MSEFTSLDVLTLGDPPQFNSPNHPLAGFVESLGRTKSKKFKEALYKCEHASNQQYIEFLSRCSKLHQSAYALASFAKVVLEQKENFSHSQKQFLAYKLYQAFTIFDNGKVICNKDPVHSRLQPKQGNWKVTGHSIDCIYRAKNERNESFFDKYKGNIFTRCTVRKWFIKLEGAFEGVGNQVLELASTIVDETMANFPKGSRMEMLLGKFRDNDPFANVIPTLPLHYGVSEWSNALSMITSMKKINSGALSNRQKKELTKNPHNVAAAVERPVKTGKPMKESTKNPLPAAGDLVKANGGKGKGVNKQPHSTGEDAFNGKLMKESTKNPLPAAGDLVKANEGKGKGVNKQPQSTGEDAYNRFVKTWEALVAAGNLEKMNPMKKAVFNRHANHMRNVKEGLSNEVQLKLDTIHMSPHIHLAFGEACSGQCPICGNSSEFTAAGLLEHLASKHPDILPCVREYLQLCYQNHFCFAKPGSTQYKTSLFKELFKSIEKAAISWSFGHVIENREVHVTNTCAADSVMIALLGVLRKGQILPKNLKDPESRVTQSLIMLDSQQSLISARLYVLEKSGCLSTQTTGENDKLTVNAESSPNAIVDHEKIFKFEEVLGSLTECPNPSCKMPGGYKDVKTKNYQCIIGPLTSGQLEDVQSTANAFFGSGLEQDSHTCKCCCHVIELDDPPSVDNGSSKDLTEPSVDNGSSKDHTGHHKRTLTRRFPDHHTPPDGLCFQIKKDTCSPFKKVSDIPPQVIVRGVSYKLSAAILQGGWHFTSIITGYEGIDVHIDYDGMRTEKVLQVKSDDQFSDNRSVYSLWYMKEQAKISTAPLFYARTPPLISETSFLKEINETMRKRFRIPERKNAKWNAMLDSDSESDDAATTKHKSSSVDKNLGSNINDGAKASAKALKKSAKRNAMLDSDSESDDAALTKHKSSSVNKNLGSAKHESSSSVNKNLGPSQVVIENINDVALAQHESSLVDQNLGLDCSAYSLFDDETCDTDDVLNECRKSDDATSSRGKLSKPAPSEAGKNAAVAKKTKQAKTKQAKTKQAKTKQAMTNLASENLKNKGKVDTRKASETVENKADSDKLKSDDATSSNRGELDKPAPSDQKVSEDKPAPSDEAVDAQKVSENVMNNGKVDTQKASETVENKATSDKSKSDDASSCNRGKLDILPLDIKASSIDKVRPMLQRSVPWETKGLCDAVALLADSFQNNSNCKAVHIHRTILQIGPTHNLSLTQCDIDQWKAAGVVLSLMAMDVGGSAEFGALVIDNSNSHEKKFGCSIALYESHGKFDRKIIKEALKTIHEKVLDAASYPFFYHGDQLKGRIRAACCLGRHETKTLDEHSGATALNKLFEEISLCGLNLTGHLSMLDWLMSSFNNNGDSNGETPSQDKSRGELDKPATSNNDDSENFENHLDNGSEKSSQDQSEPNNDGNAKEKRDQDEEVSSDKKQKQRKSKYLVGTHVRVLASECDGVSSYCHGKVVKINLNSADKEYGIEFDDEEMLFCSEKIMDSIATPPVNGLEGVKFIPYHGMPVRTLHLNMNDDELRDATMYSPGSNGTKVQFLDGSISNVEMPFSLMKPIQSTDLISLPTIPDDKSFKLSNTGECFLPVVGDVVMVQFTTACHEATITAVHDDYAIVKLPFDINKQKVAYNRMVTLNIGSYHVKKRRASSTALLHTNKRQRKQTCSSWDSIRSMFSKETKLVIDLLPKGQARYNRPSKSDVMIDNDYLNFLRQKTKERSRGRDDPILIRFIDGESKQFHLNSAPGPASTSWPNFSRVCSVIQEGVLELSNLKKRTLISFFWFDLGECIDLNERMDIRLANTFLASCYCLCIPCYHQHEESSKFVRSLMESGSFLASASIGLQHFICFVHAGVNKIDENVVHRVVNEGFQSFRQHFDVMCAMEFNSKDDGGSKDSEGIVMGDAKVFRSNMYSGCGSLEIFLESHAKLIGGHERNEFEIPFKESARFMVSSYLNSRRSGECQPNRESWNDIARSLPNIVKNESLIVECCGKNIQGEVGISMRKLMELSVESYFTHRKSQLKGFNVLENVCVGDMIVHQTIDGRFTLWCSVCESGCFCDSHPGFESVHDAVLSCLKQDAYLHRMKGVVVLDFCMSVGYPTDQDSAERTQCNPNPNLLGSCLGNDQLIVGAIDMTSANSTSDWKDVCQAIINPANTSSFSALEKAFCKVVESGYATVPEQFPIRQSSYRTILGTVKASDCSSDERDCDEILANNAKGFMTINFLDKKFYREFPRSTSVFPECDVARFETILNDDRNPINYFAQLGLLEHYMKVEKADSSDSFFHLVKDIPMIASQHAFQRSHSSMQCQSNTVVVMKSCIDVSTNQQAVCDMFADSTKYETHITGGQLTVLWIPHEDLESLLLSDYNVRRYVQDKKQLVWNDLSKNFKFILQTFQSGTLNDTGREPVTLKVDSLYPAYKSTLVLNQCGQTHTANFIMTQVKLALLFFHGSVNHHRALERLTNISFIGKDSAHGWQVVDERQLADQSGNVATTVDAPRFESASTMLKCPTPIIVGNTCFELPHPVGNELRNCLLGNYHNLMAAIGHTAVTDSFYGASLKEAQSYLCHKGYTVFRQKKLNHREMMDYAKVIQLPLLVSAGGASYGHCFGICPYPDKDSINLAFIDGSHKKLKPFPFSRENLKWIVSGLDPADLEFNCIAIVPGTKLSRDLLMAGDRTNALCTCLYLCCRSQARSRFYKSARKTYDCCNELSNIVTVSMDKYQERNSVFSDSIDKYQKRNSRFSDSRKR